jgi:hypothetical protein
LKTVNRKLKALDYFKAELEPLDPAQKHAIVEVLREFMAEIRIIFGENSAAFFKCFPKERQPCSTCALNPATDEFKGFAATAYGLLCSFRDGRPFICHDNQPGWEDNVVEQRRIIFCSSFAVVFSTKLLSAKGAAERAMIHIRALAPGMKEVQGGKNILSADKMTKAHLLQS